MACNVLPRFHGLDLPVFDPTEVISKENLPLLNAALPAGRFVREVEVDVVDSQNHIDSLKKLLDITNGELHRLSEQCDTPVIEYCWGLSGTEAAMPASLLPSGYALVAEVEAIDESACFDGYHEPEPEIREKIQKGIDRYFAEAGKCTLYDAAIRQFIVGQSVQYPESKPGPICVDIEPRITVFR